MSNIVFLEDRKKQAFREQVQQSLRIIRPDYTIVDFLGEGSFGIVYEIRNAQRDTLCLKVLATPGAGKPKVLDAVKTLGVSGILNREKYPQLLNHPNIVDVVEGINIEIREVEIPCVVQKKIDGMTLEHYLMHLGSLHGIKFARIFHGIAAGVGYIHEKGIAHRDLKLDNIKLDADNIPRIFDFSIAEMVDDNGFILSLNPAVPSQKYRAPEVLVDNHHDAKKADVWSLGLIFYELLTRNNPQREGTLYLDKHKIPKRYRRVICGCLQEDPKNRYHDGNAVYKALRHAEWHYTKRIIAAGLTLSIFCAPPTLLISKEMFGDRISTYYTNNCIDALERQHVPEQAEHFCQKAIAWNNRNCYAYLILGHSLIEQEKNEEAEEAYKTAHMLCEEDKFRGVDFTIFDEMLIYKLKLEERGMNNRAESLMRIYHKIKD